MPRVEPIRVMTWAVLLVFPLLLLWFFLRRRKTALKLRPIAAWQVLQGLIGRVAEEGKRVHLSLGRSGIGAEQTAVVSAALDVQRHMADRGAALDAPPIVTVADPLLMLAAQGMLYRAYRRWNRAADYDRTQVQLVAPDPLVYAVGAAEPIGDADTAANVMVGHLGDEYLMLGETGAQRDLLQVAGSDALNTQALMPGTADHVLLGEELFSAGAYLTRRPALIASLQAQDVMRVLAVIAILVGVIVKSVIG